jgi:hypothetical protein
MYSVIIRLLSFLSLDTAVTISLETGGHSALHEERWALISPPFVTEKSSCVNLTFEPLTHFKVRLNCINKAGAMEEHLLFRSNNSLLSESTISVLLLDISETASKFKQCTLVFETVSLKPGKMATISSIKLLPERCLMPAVGE